MKTLLILLTPILLLQSSCKETVVPIEQLSLRTVCSGTFSENYSVLLNSNNVYYSDIGAWHNTLMDYIDIHKTSFLSNANAQIVDSVRANANRGISYYTTAYPFSSIPEEVGTDVKNNLLPLIGSSFPLDSNYLNSVNSAVDLRIDSLYDSGFINLNAKSLLYDIFYDITDGNDSIDFDGLYSTLDGFYQNNDLSSAICVNTLAISEHSLCYWEDNPKPEIGNACIILVADAAGAVFHAWWAAGVRIYNHEYDYEIEDCLEDMLGGAVVSSGLSLFGL